MTRKDPPRLFVLDTNVLMHDPTALFRFQEHDIYIPMVVLEELDAGKKGMSEVARNARQASRFLDELIDDRDSSSIENGLSLNEIRFSEEGGTPRGRLFLQTQILPNKLPTRLPGNNADNSILETTRSLQNSHKDKIVTLVSKDINLRIKARVLGIHSEDYTNDKVLDDVNLLYSGVHTVAADFWDQHARDLESWQADSRTYYKIQGKPLEECYPYQCLYSEQDDRFEAMVYGYKDEATTLIMAKDHRRENNNVWGITARNREQNFALNLLMDPEVDLVTLLGVAGTGKTLLALAAGLQQTIEEKRYREIIITRVTIPLGEDIGFLPGTEEEKMAPWMGALLDNLEVLTNLENSGDWAREATTDLLNRRIKLIPQFHARPHLYQSLHHHRRGPEPDFKTNEDLDYPGRTGQQDHLPG